MRWLSNLLHLFLDRPVAIEFSRPGCHPYGSHTKTRRIDQCLDADISYLRIVPLLSCGMWTPGAMSTLDSGLYQQCEEEKSHPAFTWPTHTKAVVIDQASVGRCDSWYKDQDKPSSALQSSEPSSIRHYVRHSCHQHTGFAIHIGNESWELRQPL